MALVGSFKALLHRRGFPLVLRITTRRNADQSWRKNVKGMLVFCLRTAAAAVDITVVGNGLFGRPIGDGTQAT